MARDAIIFGWVTFIGERRRPTFRGRDGGNGHLEELPVSGFGSEIAVESGFKELCVT